MLQPVRESYLKSEVLEKTPKVSLGSEFVGRSDHEIWSAFKSGSEIALVHIYNQYFQTLYRYGSQFSRDRNFIKDTIQDLFIELLKKRHKLSDTTSIKYYLFKSLKTNIISKLRRKKSEFLEETQGYNFGITVSIEENIIHAQMDEEKKQRLNLAIKKLKKKQQEVLYYYFFEDLEMAQIASLMNFSNAKSIQNLLYRSLHLLKNNLIALLILLNLLLFYLI